MVVRTITGMGRIFTDDTTKNMALRAIYNRVQRAIKPFVDYTIFQNVDDAEYFYREKLASKVNSGVVKSSGIDIDRFNSEIDISKIKRLVEELNIDLSQRTFIWSVEWSNRRGLWSIWRHLEHVIVRVSVTTFYLWVSLIVTTP